MIAYHASHEQFSPAELLAWAVLAEKSGFDAIHSSDHLRPWNRQQGESGHSLTWLGAAMQASNLPFGLICAPGSRHHPVILAQAVATLVSMFPERLWIALGSGEAINERMTGQPWPEKSVRNARLKEAFDLISKLLDGEEISQNGYFPTRRAQIYSLSQNRPPILGAALSEKTAGWMGHWADGLLTTNQTIPVLKKIIDAFRKNGGESKPIYIKVALSYSRDEDTALAEAWEQWRTNILDGSILSELEHPEQFEEIGKFVRMDDMKSAIPISSDLDFHLEKLLQYLHLGVQGLILHNVSRHQQAFIEDFGRSVLPQLKF